MWLLAVILNITVPGESRWFIEGCFCKYEETIYPILSFLATIEEMTKVFHREKKKHAVVVQLTKGTQVGYLLPPYILTVQLLSLKP